MYSLYRGKENCASGSYAKENADKLLCTTKEAEGDSPIPADALRPLLLIWYYKVFVLRERDYRTGLAFQRVDCLIQRSDDRLLVRICSDELHRCFYLWKHASRSKLPFFDVLHCIFQVQLIQVFLIRLVEVDGNFLYLGQDHQHVGAYLLSKQLCSEILVNYRCYAFHRSVGVLYDRNTAAACSDYDLVLCGERTVDGETGQVPGQISARLNASLALGIVDIRSCENGVICLRPDERGEDELKLSFPAVVGVSCGLRGALQELKPRLEGMKRARAANIPHLDAGALGFRWDEVGEAASPTKVRSVSRVNWARECVMVESLADGVDISLEMIYGR